MAKPRLWYLKLDRSASQPGRCLPPTVALFGRTCSCVTNLVNPASSERFPEVTDCWSRFGERENVGGAPLLGAYLQHLTLCCSRPPLPFPHTPHIITVVTCLFPPRQKVQTQVLVSNSQSHWDTRVCRQVRLVLTTDLPTALVSPAVPCFQALQ